MTTEQREWLARVKPKAEYVRFFSGDVYVRSVPFAHDPHPYVLRVDPDGKVTNAEGWPERGLTIEQAEGLGDSQ